MAYFREYVRTADPLLRRAGQLVWFERLETEHENLRAALRRAVDAGDEQEALLLVLSCSWFWEVRNYLSERRYWPKRVGDMGEDPFGDPPITEPVERGPLEDPPPLTGARLVEARRWVRMVEMSAGEGDTEWWQLPSVVRIGESMIANYPPHLPQSARLPGLMRPYSAFFAGRFDELSGLVDESVDACRRHGRDWELAYALQLRAKVNNDVPDRLEDAIHDVGESRRIFERLGDEWGTAETLSAEAEAASNAGDWAHAAECCRQGIVLARKIGSYQRVPVLTVRLGENLVNMGQVEEGLRTLREGVANAEKFGADSEGAGFFGRMLLAAALSHTGQVAEALGVVEEMMRDGTAGSGQPAFVAGMLLALRGYLIGRLGEPKAGLDLLSEGMKDLADHPLANVITPRLGILLAPGAISLLSVLAEQGGPGGLGERRARRGAALVSAHDRLRPSVIPPGEVAELDDAKRRLLAVLGEQGYAAAYAEGDGLDTVEAVTLMRDVD
jgi:hypothetical protein